MKLLAGGGLVALTGGLLYVFVDQRPADVYPMPVEEAYARLAAVSYQEATGGMYSQAKTASVSANGRDKIYWKGAARRCEIALAPWAEDATNTHVTIDCGGKEVTYGPSQLAHNIYRASIIEGVDAVLTGRPFSRDKARGATADRWPGDGAVGGYNKAVGDALKMSDEVNRMQSGQEGPPSEAQQQAEMEAFYAE